MSPADAARPLAVVDLDGVLADVRHRLHFLQRRPKDWEGFFAAAGDDGVLAEGQAVAEHLSAEHEVVYLSGRPERCRVDTLGWLRRHRLPAGRVLLRPEGDRRPARVWKLERLEALATERAVAVLVDDDEAVCTAARRRGFAVLEATWMGTQSAQQTLSEAQEQEGRT